MENIREYIKNILVKTYTECSTDKYGQISKSTLGVGNLFGKNAKEVEDFCKANKSVITLAVYGWTYGTYVAVYEIIDTEIKRLCDAAFKSNENRLQNLNQW